MFNKVVPYILEMNSALVGPVGEEDKVGVWSGFVKIEFTTDHYVVLVSV